MWRRGEEGKKGGGLKGRGSSKSLLVLQRGRNLRSGRAGKLLKELPGILAGERSMR